MTADNSRPDWVTWFRQLDGLAEDANAAQRAQRGRDFEKLLGQMLNDAGLSPRTSFKPKGEEIDGSFLHRGRVMLLEAKWTKESQPASALYAFRGKLDGKLVGTLGLFISMAGYSRDTIDALVAGKALNLILMDGDDLRLIANRDIGITDALDLKLRAAAETGNPFQPLAARVPGSDQVVPVTSASSDTSPVRAVITEGLFDEFVLTALTSLRRPGVEDLVFFVAGGRNNLGLVAHTVTTIAPQLDRVVVVADGDNDPEMIRLVLEQQIDPILEREVTADVIVLTPNLETVFGLKRPDVDRRLRPAGRERGEILKRLHSVELSDLARDPDVANLLDALAIPYK